MGKELLDEYLESDSVTGELTPRTLEIIEEVVKELKEEGFGERSPDSQDNLVVASKGG